MEDNLNKAIALQNRMIEFAANTITLVNSSKLPRNLIDQVTRSVASIGANYCEAINEKLRINDQCSMIKL